MRRDVDSAGERRRWVETLEHRTMMSVAPALVGEQTFSTRTVLTVEAGTLGQPITFNVTVSAPEEPISPVDLFYHGKLFQVLYVTPTASPDPNVAVSQATYTVPAGPAGAEIFAVGPHLIRALSNRIVDSRDSTFRASASVAVFRIQRPQFVQHPSGIGTATSVTGSGPTLQPGQTATVQYDAYLAASYRLFDSTTSQTPDTETFIVDASPEQVIPGLDAGVVGMQAGETRAIYIPRSLSRGIRGSLPARQPRANLVFLVTLVSID